MSDYRNKRETQAPQTPRKQAKEVFEEKIFKPAWITEGADKEMVEYAEHMGKFMAGNGLTSSKIRNVYGEVKRIQMDFQKNRASFYLLTPKVAYAVGRDKNIQGLRLFQLVFNAAAENVTDEKTYLNFCNFIEAVLAYHKAYVEKDN